QFLSNLFLSLTIAILVESLGVVGSGVPAIGAAFATFITGRSRAARTRTLDLAVVFCVAGFASLVDVTSVSFLPTLVVFSVVGVASLVGVTSVSFLSTLVGFCGVSLAFVCLSLSFSSAVVATFFS